MADHLFIDDTQDVEGKFIGWDYAHAGDYAGYYGDKGILADEKKWTTQEIFEEVKDACYQLKQLEEESPADELFEELGYEIDSTRYTFENEKHLFYCKDYTRIDFDITRKNIYKYNLSGYRSPISMQELKAINKKCQELGWIE